MQRFCLALDLIDNADSIREYEHYHAPGSAWPEVTQHDLDAGILNIEIFRTGNRMFMILETNDEFNFEKKAAFDATNPKITEGIKTRLADLQTQWGKEKSAGLIIKKSIESYNEQYKALKLDPIQL
jgi:L-rhamnose mutarotase